MKVIIAGSRSITHTEPRHQLRVLELIDQFQEAHGDITMIVSGNANGPDKIGENIAKVMNLDLAIFKAKWDLQGRAAGIIRNAEMAEFADAGIILWDGESRGSKHMSETLKKAKKPIILDILVPVVYNYVHQPSGIIKVTRPESPSLNDTAYD